MTKKVCLAFPAGIVRLFIPILLLILLFSIHTQAQAPANDECAGAIALNVNNGNASAISYNGVLGYATESMPPCTGSFYPAKDVWYKFVATATVHNITLSPSSYDDYALEVFKGSCGALASIGCFNNSTSNEIEAIVLNDLIPSNTYYIRVYNIFGDASPSRKFNIYINGNTNTIVNDECMGALNVPIADDGKQFTNIGATLSMPVCTGAAQRDVWFKFTATSARHQIFSTPNSGFDPVITEAFTGDCDHLVSMNCSDDPSQQLDLTGLVPGTTYYYRVALGNYSSLQTNIYTRVKALPPPPANDECSGAILMPVNNNNTSQLSYNSSLQYATESMPGCVPGSYKATDTWYKFVATAEEHNITLNPTSYNDYIFEVFAGNCGQLTSLACVNETSLNEKEITVIRNLQIGGTYYIRVYNRYGYATPTMTFNLCINTSQTTIPNDECAGAINIPVKGRGEGSEYTNVGATLSIPACAGVADNDIWFKFTATQSRHRIYTEAREGNDPIVMQVFQGSCANLTSILCYNGSSQLADLIGLNPGTTYYYRVYMGNGSNLRTNIYTEVSAPPPPPANDECTGAISLPVNNSNGSSLSYNSSLEYATQSRPACSYTGYEANDTWYKFVATATSHNVVLTPNSFNDFAMEIFAGDCNGLSSITCADASGLNEKESAVANNLAPGQTYYIRVYNHHGDATPTRTFNIMINASTSTIPNDECTGAIDIPIGEPNSQLTYSNIGATLSIPACSGVAHNDIWFKFTATSTRHQVSAYASSGDQPVFIQVFKGDCASLVPLLCYDYFNGLADLSNLTPGETYFYRIYFGYGDPLRTDFRTAVRAPLPKPPTPILNAANPQCATDTLKVAVSNIAAGNTVAGYLNGNAMNYDQAGKFLWWYPNPGNHSTVKAIQVTPEQNISDTAVVQIATQPLGVANVMLGATAQHICEGEPVTLTASITNGGDNPDIRWEVNGQQVLAGAGHFTSSSFRDGDTIVVKVISNAACTHRNPVPSNEVILRVNPRISITSTISAPENICASSDFLVTVNPGPHTPDQTIVRLFEETTPGNWAIVTEQAYASIALNWNIMPTDTAAARRFFADMVPPAAASCFDVRNSDTIVAVATSPPATPKVVLYDNLLKITNYDGSTSVSWQFRSGNTWSDIEGAHLDVLAAMKEGLYRTIIRTGACEAFGNEILVVAPAAIKYYPVPTQDIINIGPLFENDQWESLEVIGLDGKVYISENIGGRPNARIDVRHLPGGIYMIRMRSRTGNSTQKKFVKL